MRKLKPKPTILLHCRDNFDHTVILSVNGIRWEYTLTPQQADTVEYLCKRISARKALAFARSRSTRQVKL